MLKYWIWCLRIVLAALPVLATVAQAQDYPRRPVRLIVPFPPGGAGDLSARILGEKLSERLGQQVIVENKPGAGGNIGADFVAKAPPDGYTLLEAPSSAYAVGVTLYKKVPFNLLKDLAPISTVAVVAHIINVNPNVPAKSLNELITIAKSRPRELNMASQGIGTTSHLECALVSSVAGIEMTHVPYNGSTQAIPALIAGNVQVMCDSVTASLGNIRAGKLRPLAVLGEKRSALLPEVPTVAESGLHGFNAETWIGVMAPAATPRAIIGRLQQEITSILADPAVQKRLLDTGLEPQSSTSEHYAHLIKAEIDLWGKVVKASGATTD